MSAKSAISKEVFIPHDEKMLAAVQVKRRTKKKIPFLATGGQGDYMTFICLSGQPKTIPAMFVVNHVRVCHCVKPKVTLQHVFPNSLANVHTDEHVYVSSANRMAH